MSTSDSVAGGAFEVGVAIVSMDSSRDSGVEPGAASVPGFDEAAGGWGRHALDAKAVVVVKGEEAVRVATEALGGQVGITARRIAAAIEAQTREPPAPDGLGVESVEVSFGITLTGGVQALHRAGRVQCPGHDHDDAAPLQRVVRRRRGLWRVRRGLVG